MPGAAPLVRERPRAGSRWPVVAEEPLLVGRDAEIEVLAAVLADPEAPGVLLSGPPGVGRTRLLREAVRIGERLGLRTLRIAGSAAAEGIPLGALARVLPPVPGRPDRFALLQHALAALRGDDGERPLLAVDDAHRLDELTIAVLEQLVLGGDALVVVTEQCARTPSGPCLPDPLHTLRDEVCTVTVAPLPDRQADRLMEVVLGGDVDARTAQRMKTLARGRPLVLRELLRSGHETGRLTRQDRLWHWDGDMELPLRLRACSPDDAGPSGPDADRRHAAPGPPVGPGDASDAARANRELDHPRAERVARGLVHDDPDGGAHLELIEAVRWQDRGDELGPLLAAAEIRVPSGDGSARIALTRALLTRRRGRPASQTGPDASGTGPAQVAVRETVARLDGLAGPEDRHGPDPAEVPLDGPWAALAGAARAGRLAAAGRCDPALDAVVRVRELLDRDGDQVEAALARLLLVDAELSALRVAGRGEDMERVAEEAHRHNLSTTGWAGDAWIAWHRGRAALVRGDLAEAARGLAEARSGVARRDPLALAADCTGSLALVHVLSGDLDRARKTLRGATSDPPEVARPALVRARVWLEATGRSGVPTLRPLLDAARSAAVRGDRVVEAVLLHDAVRLGRADLVADRLTELSRGVGAPMLGLFAAHAAAARDGAADRLDRVAARLAATGARPDAADVAAAAAAAHHATGDRRRSAVSAARAVRLADECGGLQTPALRRVVRPHLTSREREIAGLVAGGASNAEVARRLVLSVRTVETHLAHAYAKLGIDGRAELVAALPPDTP